MFPRNLERSFRNASVYKALTGIIALLKPAKSCRRGDAIVAISTCPDAGASPDRPHRRGSGADRPPQLVNSSTPSP
ncbi:hypothetical protein BS78_06G201400 [Paspalum vaginatum]|nr:hypothetical protein BS78_06G201400 [Paspalum vaginatum]KAJ1272435.1 hypothetical protein BS78_06G201400 [Paspalum vaginatum]KAJ1272436.1 hypothetical protein BS78_06G201400 [Paspalum vaginatum]